MSNNPGISPGTVSKILWHFTGGPIWNPKTKKQNSSPKPAAQAYANLKSILRSGVVRLGTYKEVVKVVLPEHREFNPVTRKMKVLKNFPIEIESSSICCVSDIPAAHLRYQAYRYGKFALGFHREAVIRSGFNPVFYTLDDAPLIRSIYEGFSSLELADLSQIRYAAGAIDSDVYDVETELDVSSEVGEIEAGVESVEETLSVAKQSLEDFVAFVKTFHQSEFSTIYCEREWRSTREFTFHVDDLAMVVLPRLIGSVHYFQNFVERVAPSLRLPRRVPVVPWDDLVEH